MATKQISAREAINLTNACLSVEGEGHAKFLFATKRNEHHLKQIIKDLEESRQESIGKDYYVYQAKRENIFRDWQSKLKKESGDFNFGEHTPEVEKELKALYEEFESVLKDTERKLEEWSDALENPVDAIVHEVNFEHLPTRLAPAQLDHFKPMVSDWNTAWDSIQMRPLVMTYHEVLQVLGEWTANTILAKFKMGVGVGMKLVVLNEALKKVQKQVAQFREDKMGANSEFKEVVVKRNAIMRDETTSVAQKAEAIGQLLASLDEATKAKVDKVEKETEEFMNSMIPDFKIPIIKIDEFDCALDATFVGCLMPFIIED